MGPIVPLLRLSMALLNIYDTFKVLKPPRVSRRSSGPPSAQAMSQRKRAMKGCLAVWIVWCCFAIYERMAEAIVSLFIPFYDEAKTLVLLFLIFTRARGAEPIYLHIIRPFLKPYTSTVDAIFDVARTFGDLVFVMFGDILAYPYNLVSAWWKSRPRTEQPLFVANGRSHHSVPLTPPATRRRWSGGANRDDVRNATAVPAQPSSLRRRPSAERVGHPSDGRVHQIWHPPRSAYQAEEEQEEEAMASTPPELSPQEQSRREREQASDLEWRQYPPFPSAYPPTPLPQPSFLPTLAAAAEAGSTSMPPLFPPRAFSPIIEDDQEQEPQGFGQSLPSPPELPNSGSVRGVSDQDNKTLGIHIEADTMDEDYEAEGELEEEEDDFNVTLRTPSSLLLAALVTRSLSEQSVDGQSVSSLATTAADASPVVILPPLLSRMSSESSTSSSPSAGQKRSREAVVPVAPGTVHDRKFNTSPVRQSRGRGRRAVAGRKPMPLRTIEDESSATSATSSSATSDEGEDEEKEGEDASASGGSSEPKSDRSPVTKRRRVGVGRGAAQPPLPGRVQPARQATRARSQDVAQEHEREPPATVRRRREPRAKEGEGQEERAAPPAVAPAAVAAPTRASSRLASVGPAPPPEGTRRKVVAAAGEATRPSRRAPAGTGTGTAKRK